MPYFIIPIVVVCFAVQQYLHVQTTRRLEAKIDWERQRADQQVKQFTDRLLLMKVNPPAAAALVEVPEAPYLSLSDDEALAEYEQELIENA